MEILDKKYTIIAVKTEDGSPVPPDQCILFRAKDNAFLPTLEFYIKECKWIGASEDFIGELQMLRNRIKVWRSYNMIDCKTPD